MKNSKKIIVVIAILIIALLISGTAFAYVYIATDTFKTDKELFFKYFGQINSEDGFIDQRIEQFNTKKTQTPYENSGELTIELIYPEEYLNTIIDKVNELSIGFSGKIDSQNQKVERNIEVRYGDNVTFPVTYKQDGDKFGIQIRELSEQFIGIKNENLKEFATKFGIEDVSKIPDKIEATEVKEEFSFTPEEIEQLKQIYGTVLNQQLLEENFSKTKTEQGENYTLELNTEQIKNIIIKMLEATKENDLIIDKINELILAQDSEAETIEISEIDDIIETINEEDISDMENLKLTLVQDNKQLNQIVIQLGENQILIEKNETTDGFSYNFNCDIKNSVEKNSILEDTESPMQYNIYFNVEYSGLENLNTIQENYQIGFKASDEENTMKYDYKINSNTEFKDSVSIEELSEDEAVFLNEHEGNEIINFLTNVGNKILEINKNQMEELGLEEDENPLIYANPITGLSMSIYNMASETVDDTSSSLSEYELQLFNNKFEVYLGESMSSSDVRALIKTVQNSNISSIDAILVKVTLDGSEISDLNNVDLNSKYKVEALYGDEGYITEIKITTNN